ncbi:MAG TPA: hypothetical protein VF171_04560 [Trueperaceae bacterium]
MSADVKNKGNYELFETTHHHKILVLNDKKWYAWVQGDQGDVLVRSDSDHRKDHTLQKGSFYLVDFQDDPKFQDMPHLFLQKDNHYQELLLPNGLPTNDNYQKKLVAPDDTVGKDELEKHLKQAG